jgi:hypothetical protein
MLSTPGPRVNRVGNLISHAFRPTKSCQYIECKEMNCSVPVGQTLIYSPVFWKSDLSLAQLASGEDTAYVVKDKTGRLALCYSPLTTGICTTAEATSVPPNSIPLRGLDSFETETLGHAESSDGSHGRGSKVGTSGWTSRLGRVLKMVLVQWVASTDRGTPLSSC